MNTLKCFSRLDRAVFEAIAEHVPLRLSLSGFAIGMKSANPLLISQIGWDHLAILKLQKNWAVFADSVCRFKKWDAESRGSTAQEIYRTRGTLA